MDNNFENEDEFVKVDLKNGSKNSKDFILSFFSNPTRLLKAITKSKDNKLFNVSILVLLIWIIVTFITSLFAYNYTYDAFSLILVIIRDLTIPILSIGFLSLIIHCINPNKENSSSLTNTVTSTITCKIPIIISSFLSLLTLVTPKACIITEPIRYFCIALSTLLTYFAIKYLYNESEDGKSFKMFVIVEAIFYVVYLLLSFLDIYLV